MPNTLLTISQITREAYRLLVNNIVFASRVNRNYDSEFGRTGAKIGDVLNVRLPMRYTNTTGQGLQIQDVTETSVPVTLTTQYQRAFTFPSAALALSVDDFSDRFVKPAVASMANQIDYDGLQLFYTVANQVGTPGVTPSTTTTYLNAGVKLDNNAAPVDGERCIVFSPRMQANLVDAVKGLFNPQAQISDYTRKGELAKEFLGFDWYMDQNVGTYVTGPLGGAPTVNGLLQTGSSVITANWTATTAKRLSKGDIVTFSNTYGVNPQNRQTTGELQQFVVTADCSDAAGAITIPISPAIVASGAFQNVTTAPTTGDVVAPYAAASTQTPQALAFHKEAFVFANVDLELPNGVDMKERVSSKYAGLSLRLIRQYDINTDRWPLRLDLLGGWAAIYPQWACRISA